MIGLQKLLDGELTIYIKKIHIVCLWKLEATESWQTNMKILKGFNLQNPLLNMHLLSMTGSNNAYFI